MFSHVLVLLLATFVEARHLAVSANAPGSNGTIPDYVSYLTNQTSTGYLDMRLSTVMNGTIRVAFPRGSGGHDPTNVVKCGMRAIAPYPPSFDNTKGTLDSDIFFEPGFAFDQGKLGLGFEMGTANATGGNGTATASSCRVIFRKNGAASCYIYVPLGSKQTDPELQAFADGNSKYGKEFFLDAFPEGTFKTNVTHKVSIGVKMNTPGNADGECFMTIDNITMRKIGIMWLTDNVYSGISIVNNSAFVGGDWVSSKDQWFQMSQMKLTAGFPTFSCKREEETEIKYSGACKI